MAYPTFQEMLQAYTQANPLTGIAGGIESGTKNYIEAKKLAEAVAQRQALASIKERHQTELERHHESMEDFNQQHLSQLDKHNALMESIKNGEIKSLNDFRDWQMKHGDEDQTTKASREADEAKKTAETGMLNATRLKAQLPGKSTMDKIEDVAANAVSKVSPDWSAKMFPNANKPDPLTQNVDQVIQGYRDQLKKYNPNAPTTPVAVSPVTPSPTAPVAPVVDKRSQAIQALQANGHPVTEQNINYVISQL